MRWLKRNRRIRGKRIAFFLAAIVAVIAYGRLFFSSGVEVDGAFLERQAPSQDAQTTVYKEFPLGVTATVTGEKTDSARIVFRLPDGEKSSYAIHTSREGDLVSASILTENDKEICRGVLKENGVWDSHTETEEGKADKICRALTLVFSAGMIFAFVLLCVRGTPNFTLLAFALFLAAGAFGSGRGGAKYVRIDFSYKDAFRRGVEIRRVAVTADCTLKKAVAFVGRGRYLILDVYDDEEEYLGEIGQNELAEMFASGGLYSRIGDFL